MPPTGLGQAGDWWRDAARLPDLVGTSGRRALQREKKSTGLKAPPLQGPGFPTLWILDYVRVSWWTAAMVVSLLSRAREATADAKYVPVRVAQVHLADVPRHVGRWEGDFQTSGHALFVDLVNVVHPD